MRNVRSGFIVALMLAFAFLPIGNQMFAQQVGRTANTNPITISATGFTQIIAPVAGQSVSVNNWGMETTINASTGQTVQFVSCTDGTCSTGSQPITGVLAFVGPVTTSAISNMLQETGNPAFVTNPGSGVFAKATGTQLTTGWMTFTQN